MRGWTKLHHYLSKGINVSLIPPKELEEGEGHIIKVYQKYIRTIKYLKDAGIWTQDVFFSQLLNGGMEACGDFWRAQLIKLWQQ